MRTFRVYVELGYYYGGGTDGAWMSHTSDQFETTVTAQHWVEAEKMVSAQYGGQEKCKVRVLN